jgi:hypothetical protein
MKLYPFAKFFQQLAYPARFVCYNTVGQILLRSLHDEVCGSHYWRYRLQLKGIQGFGGVIRIIPHYSVKGQTERCMVMESSCFNGAEAPPA